MTIKECYDSFGGSFEDVKHRLSSDALIQRLVIKFLADGSFDSLKDALEKGDYPMAFRAAHTLKGVCQNLSFDRLSKSSGEMTELLRGKSGDDVDKAECDRIWAVLAKDYEDVTGAITIMRDSQ